ncbi:MAG: hypothetical protein ACKVOT_05740 [Polaromonas sp.]
MSAAAESNAILLELLQLRELACQPLYGFYAIQKRVFCKAKLRSNPPNRSVACSPCALTIASAAAQPLGDLRWPAVQSRSRAISRAAPAAARRAHQFDVSPGRVNRASPNG